MPAPAPPPELRLASVNDAASRQAERMTRDFDRAFADFCAALPESKQQTVELGAYRQPTYAEWLATRPGRVIRVICELIPMDAGALAALERAEDFHAAAAAIDRKYSR